MKRTIAFLLAAVLLLSLVPAFSAAEDETLPQSAHPYENNVHQEWTYTHPEPVSGLIVTFSNQGYLAPGVSYSVLEGDFSEEQLAFYADHGYYNAPGDRLTIYDGNGELYGWYTKRELSGATFLIPGSSFRLVLDTDEAGTGFGFAVERVTAELPAGKAMVNYLIDGENAPLVVSAGGEILLNAYYQMRQVKDRIIHGWQGEDGARYEYDNVNPSRDGLHTGLVAEAGRVYTFTPLTCPIGMRKEEVYSFRNSDSVFNAELDGYLYTKEHYVRTITNWYATFGLTPFMPVAAGVCAYLTLYWPTMEFVGSCCGFPITTMLQHEGKLDLLSRQGVQNVCELEPDEELQSLINYYNNQAVACHVANNLAINPGTAAYTEQLKSLYAVLEKGTPVYFELYPDSQHPVKTIATRSWGDNIEAHGILLTGAYTDADGRHILIAWDNNSGNYVGGTCDILYINEDFTEIHERMGYDWYGDGLLNGFSWNDDLSALDSFKAEGVSNPVAWHVAFLQHLRSFLQQLFDLFGILRSEKAENAQ